MKKFLFLGSLVTMVWLLLWPVLFRSKGLELEIRFTYSRTMEHLTVRDNQTRIRLREKSCRALRLLFDDWAWDSRTGEKSFCEMVKDRFVESFGGEDGRLQQKEVDDLIKGLRFTIIGGPMDEVPVVGKFTIGPGSPSVVKALAEVLKECMSQYIEKENESWAEKASMGLGVEFQRLEREFVALNKRCSKACTDEEKSLLKHKIVEMNSSIDDVKKEWEKSMKIYRERMDATIVFLQ